MWVRCIQASNAPHSTPEVDRPQLIPLPERGISHRSSPSPQWILKQHPVTDQSLDLLSVGEDTPVGLRDRAIILT